MDITPDFFNTDGIIGYCVVPDNLLDLLGVFAGCCVSNAGQDHVMAVRLSAGSGTDELLAQCMHVVQTA